MVPWAEPAGAVPLDDEAWYEISSPHFTVVSGAGRSQARSIARDLERLRWALGGLTNLELLSPVPIRVYVFPNDRAFQPYKHLYHGAPATMSGAFYARADLDVLTLHGARGGEARLTVQHEYVHAVLRNNLPGLPLWLEEGLAELYSTFEVVSGKPRLGRAIPWHLRTLKKGTLLPLADLLAADTASALYQEFDDQGMFYARAWELVHHLFERPGSGHRQAFAYAAQVRRGVDPEAAFRRAFGQEPAALERALGEHRGERYSPRIPGLGPLPSPPLEERRLDYGELLYLLGDLLLSQGGRRDDAAFHFEQALARAERQRAEGLAGHSRDLPRWVGRAAAGLGGLEAAAGDYAAARGRYRRALELSPRDPALAFRYGASLLILGRATSDAKRVEARRYLERSLGAEPDFVPAWDALRLATRLDQASMASLDGRLRERPETVLGLMVLYARQGRAGEARRLRSLLPEEASVGGVRGWGQRADDLLERLRWLAGEGPAELQLLRSSSTEPMAADPPSSEAGEAAPGSDRIPAM